MSFIEKAKVTELRNSKDACSFRLDKANNQWFFLPDANYNVIYSALLVAAVKQFPVRVDYSAIPAGASVSAIWFEERFGAPDGELLGLIVTSGHKCRLRLAGPNSNQKLDIALSYLGSVDVYNSFVSLAIAAWVEHYRVSVQTDRSYITQIWVSDLAQ